MGEPVISLDTSTVRPGKLEELKAAIQALVRFVEANEPRTIAYSVYLSEDGTRMTVLQVHPDSASMELHMRAAGPAFEAFVELVDLSAMDVYGTASEELLRMLEQKASMLGAAPVAAHEPYAGFQRFEAQAERVG